MENKNIQLFKPKYRKEEVLKEIEECLDLGWTGLGFKTNKFEEAFKQYASINYAHYVASNTVGLQIAIKILKDTINGKIMMKLLLLHLHLYHQIMLLLIII